MTSPKDLSPPGFTLADYEDGMKTFNNVESLMQRLEDRANAKTMPIGQGTIHLMHELVRFCRAAVEQYRATFTECMFLSQRIVVEDSVPPPPGLILAGFDKPQFPTGHASRLKDLARECKVRTREVVDRVDQELDRLSMKQEEQDILKYSTIAKDSGFIEKYATFLERHGPKANQHRSPYMNKKIKRLQNEIETDLLPHLNDLLKCIFGLALEDSNDTVENQIAKKVEVELRFTHCMEVASHSLSSISDSLNIKVYARNEVPYKRNLTASTYEGAFGVVYQAHDTNTGDIFAVKQLSKICTAGKVAAVRQELYMLEMCDHKNIITLFDAYQVEDNPSAFFLVIHPWAPYTLNSFIYDADVERREACTWFVQGSLLTEIQIIQIFAGLASGVGYLHNNRIKHKDIKPDNILLYDAGKGIIRPIISDLGISKIFKVGGHTNFTGTSTFLAPEQYHKIESTLKSDIWQLGCCFALTLAVLRNGSTGSQQLWQSLENTDIDSSCTIALESKRFMAVFENICGRGTSTQQHMYRIITKMLEMKPADRWDIERVNMEIALILSSPAYL